MSKPKIQHLSNCLRFVGPGAGPCICWLLRAERETALDDARGAVESFDWSPNTGMDFGCGEVTDAIDALKGEAHE